MRPRVLIAEPDSFDTEARSMLEAHAEVVLEQVTRARLAEAFREFDAIWVRLAHRIDAATIGDAPRARFVACPVTGLDHIDLEACRSRSIEVLSLRGETAFLREVRATAELTIGLMLALLRKIPFAMQSVCAGTWNRDLFRGGELHGKTVGLVGVGRLGTLVAKMLAGFDVTVLGVDPRSDFPDGVAERVGTLAELLERADIVSLHVTYDETTRHLIGARQLSVMRTGAALVNTSRGGVVDEAALLAALESGALAGAALDVLEGEPNLVLEGHPLVEYARSHDNLVLVPHIGGKTVESTQKTERFIAKKLLAALGVESER